MRSSLISLPSPRIHLIKTKRLSACIWQWRRRAIKKCGFFRRLPGVSMSAARCVYLLQCKLAHSGLSPEWMAMVVWTASALSVCFFCLSVVSAASCLLIGVCVCSSVASAVISLLVYISSAVGTANTEIKVPAVRLSVCLSFCCQYRSLSIGLCMCLFVVSTVVSVLVYVCVCRQYCGLFIGLCLCLCVVSTVVSPLVYVSVSHSSVP